MSFIAYTENVCTSTDDGSSWSDTVCTNGVPTINIYNDSDCKTLIGSYSAHTGCQSETINGIYVDQTINGCTYSNFSTNFYNYTNAVKDAIVMSLSSLNITEGNIYSFNVFSVPSSAPAVQVNYYIQSDTFSASDLNSTLTLAVSSGNFSTNLKAAAISNDATGLEIASSSSGDIAITDLSPIVTSTLFGCTNPAPTPPTPPTPSNDANLLSVVQTIDGCSYQEYQTSPTIYQKTIIDAVVKSLNMSGITDSNIEDLTVTALSSSRKLLSSSAIQASYLIVSDTISASSLQSALTTAVSTGAFTTNLQAAAISNSAYGLVSATSTSSDITITNLSPTSAPTTTTSLSPTSAPTPTPSKRSLAGPIAGALIAFFVLCIGGCFTYTYFQNKKSTSIVTESSSTVSPFVYRVTSTTTQTECGTEVVNRI